MANPETEVLEFNKAQAYTFLQMKNAVSHLGFEAVHTSAESTSCGFRSGGIEALLHELGNIDTLEWLE